MSVRLLHSKSSPVTKLHASPTRDTTISTVMTTERAAAANRSDPDRRLLAPAGGADLQVSGRESDVSHDGSSGPASIADRIEARESSLHGRGGLLNGR